MTSLTNISTVSLPSILPLFVTSTDTVISSSFFIVFWDKRRFEYSNLRLSQNTIKNEEEITVSVDVTNKGNMDGKETVLMFVNDVISSVLTPTKQLKGFEKVFIKAGKTVTVNLKLNIKDLAIVTRDLEYIVEKGKFEIMVGRNTKEYLKDILSVEENIKL